jgi:hypothetical protein
MTRKNALIGVFQSNVAGSGFLGWKCLKTCATEDMFPRESEGLLPESRASKWRFCWGSYLSQEHQNRDFVGAPRSLADRESPHQRAPVRILG